MNDLNLVVSTKALAIKFPTPNGTGCIRGKQYSARRCYKEALEMQFKRKKVNVVSRGGPRIISERGVSHTLDPREADCDQATDLIGELEDIIISNADAERCLKLGKGLTLEVKSQLIDFLKVNLDVLS